MRNLLSFLMAWTFLSASAFAQDGPDAKAEKPAPKEIIVGGYLNDVQVIDLKTHSFLADIYVWFRWTDPELDPLDTFEFMNLHDPEAHVEDTWYDEPKKLPDGTFYNIIRHQGAFSTKFPLDNYPFDKQELRIIVEDAEYGSGDVIYVPDETPMTLGTEISLPGYNVGKPVMRITDQPYPTRFGDITKEMNEPYSRVTFVMPIARPWKSGVVKGILPISIILLCAGLALLVHPRYTEGRIGLVITALLTLVALQITSASDLPDTSYLMIIDQIYLLSYAFILIVLAEVVENTWRKDEAQGNWTKAIRRDRMALIISLIGFAVILSLILKLNLG